MTMYPSDWVKSTPPVADASLEVLSAYQGVFVPTSTANGAFVRTRRESAMTIVEVLIAATLLTAVISGLALAVSSGMRAQSAAKSSKSLYAVSQRVFEQVKSDRDWMDSCETINAACDIRSSVPAELLEDKSAGPACTGGGTYRHDLRVARAVAIDSPVDGVGIGPAGKDADRRIPDYYKVRIEVAVADCARARLGGPDPAIFESAVDRSGNIPEGSLEIEVCRAVNQVDDRVSMAGCAGTGSDSVEMLPCPPASPVWNNTPAANCAGVHALVKGRPPIGDLSPSTVLARSTANFTVEDALGNVVGNSGSAAQPTPGIYRFPKLPAGVYFLRGITPTGAAAGMALWDTKMIPSTDAGGNRLGLVVQPDVQSRGLLTFRPKDVGSLNLEFWRRVTVHNVRTVHTPETLVETGIPTSDWEGDETALLAELTEDSESFREFTNTCATSPVLDCAGTRRVFEKVSANCYKVGYIARVVDTTTNEVVADSTDGRDVTTTCTVYDLYAEFTYDMVAGQVPSPDRLGAPMGAAYGTMAMPTFRYVVPPETARSAGNCSGTPTAQFGGRSLLLHDGCVGTRDAGAA
ncbi:MAG: hypothetical protein JWO69_422, partial [Thermoleophilia bacterium]|nr:hypothetical protein [Thermoleophilia bacterium]